MIVYNWTISIPTPNKSLNVTTRLRLVARYLSRWAALRLSEAPK